MCRVCKEARDRGVPFYRTGPSLYLPEQNILFDVPEEIREQLNRERVGHIKHVFISHWHPDHTMGIRIFETMNYGFGIKPSQKSILYVSKETAKSLAKFLPSFISLYEKRKIIETTNIKEGEAIEFENLKITPYTIPKSDTFIFKLRDREKVAIYAPCDIGNFPLRKELMKPDLLILHLGYFKEIVPPTLEISEEEESFDDNLRLIKRLEAKKTVFMHIEEVWDRSFDDYRRMEYQLKEFNIKFAYDGMIMKL
jgi:phosphoribosyl 1,2-cyclic phosphate phosphodiesterase